MKSVTDYSPVGIIILISASLGLGTMIGWKRVSTTIGEKISKQQLSYAEGLSAQIVAATTIGLSTWLGLPVSTTQVLSSGVAGGVVASNGVSNLQLQTIKRMGLAWLLTFPVTMVVSCFLFLSFYYLFR